MKHSRAQSCNPTLIATNLQGVAQERPQMKKATCFQRQDELELQRSGATPGSKTKEKPARRGKSGP
jgi:hypothetical protein